MVGSLLFRLSIGAEGRKEGLGSSSCSIERGLCDSCWMIFEGKEGWEGVGVVGSELELGWVWVWLRELGEVEEDGVEGN